MKFGTRFDGLPQVYRNRTCASGIRLAVVEFSCVQLNRGRRMLAFFQRHARCQCHSESELHAYTLPAGRQVNKARSSSTKVLFHKCMGATTSLQGSFLERVRVVLVMVLVCSSRS